MYVKERIAAYRHLSTKALSGDLLGVKRLDLSIIEQEPLVPRSVSNEAVIMASVGCSRVDGYTYQIVLVRHSFLLCLLRVFIFGRFALLVILF